MSEQNLLKFEGRVAYVVTELNGFRSCIVNEEITDTDCDRQKLSALLEQLTELEGSVNRLADLFYSTAVIIRGDPEKEKPNPCDADMANPPSIALLLEWEDEGGCEAIDGCWTEPDGHCPHGCPSWLLALGLI